MTRMEVVTAFAKATGRTFTVHHVPRPALAVGHRELAHIKPEIASLMGMSHFSDTHPGTWDDTPLREAGIEPRPASAYITEAAAAAR